MAAIILLVIATVTTVNAIIDTSRYGKYYKSQPKATYSDIVKAMFLVDFNLGNSDLDNFEMLAGPEVKNWTSKFPKISGNDYNVKYWITADGYSQAISQMDKLAKTFAAVKSNNDYHKPRYSQFYNALYMALNYDFMGQILDPNYKANFADILQAPESYIMPLKMSTFKRWRVDLIGFGTRHINYIIRGHFLKLSEKEREEARQQVYRLYVNLDVFVLKTLNENLNGNSCIVKEKLDHHQTQPTYKEILNAAQLIDFNFSERELIWIKEFARPTKQATANPEIADNCAKELSKIMSWFPNQNVQNVGQDERTKRFFNAVYLIINYDAMGQILDPDFEPRLLNFTRAIEEAGKSADIRLKMSAMQILHNRWTPDLTGVGLKPPGLQQGWRTFGTYLYQYFEKANENMENVKREVFRMRSRLDKFVLDVLVDEKSST